MKKKREEKGIGRIYALNIGTLGGTIWRIDLPY